MNADPHQRKVGNRLELIDDAQSQSDAIGGLIAAEHDPIAKRLQLVGPIAGKQPANPPVQDEGDVGGSIVAPGVCQRGEAHEIREQEGVLFQDDLSRLGY